MLATVAKRKSMDLGKSALHGCKAQLRSRRRPCHSQASILATPLTIWGLARRQGRLARIGWARQGALGTAQQTSLGGADAG
jgi:hypothetical protein